MGLQARFFEPAAQRDFMGRGCRLASLEPAAQRGPWSSIACNPASRHKQMRRANNARQQGEAFSQVQSCTREQSAPVGSYAEGKAAALLHAPATESFHCIIDLNWQCQQTRAPETKGLTRDACHRAEQGSSWAERKKAVVADKWRSWKSKSKGRSFERSCR